MKEAAIMVDIQISNEVFVETTGKKLKYFSNDGRHVRIGRSEGIKVREAFNEMRKRIGNAQYISYLMYLVTFLNNNNELYNLSNSKVKGPMSREDIVERLKGEFDISDRTIRRFLSDIKNANVLIPSSEDNSKYTIYYMNPAFYNAAPEYGINIKLFLLFPNDIVKMIDAYKFIHCSKVITDAFNGKDQTKYLRCINEVNENISKVVNGEEFVINKTPKKITWTKAVEAFKKDGISKVLGLPLNTLFNCIFHLDKAESAMVLKRSNTELYYCRNKDCVSTEKMLGNDIINLIAMLKGWESDPEWFKLSVEYLCMVYNYELEETVNDKFSKLSAA